MSRGTLTERVTVVEAEIKELRNDLKEADKDRKETKSTVLNIERTLNELVNQNKERKERWNWLKNNLPAYFALALIILGWLMKQDAIFHL